MFLLHCFYKIQKSVWLLVQLFVQKSGNKWNQCQSNRRSGDGYFFFFFFSFFLYMTLSASRYIHTMKIQEFITGWLLIRLHLLHIIVLLFAIKIVRIGPFLRACVTYSEEQVGPLFCACFTYSEEQTVQIYPTLLMYLPVYKLDRFYNNKLLIYVSFAI